MERVMAANVLIPNPSAVIAPPFTIQTATQKVRLAEDAWNSRDPVRVALAYTEDSVWRNRGEFVIGRDQIRAFLAGKWERELDYRLVKALWAFTDNRIGVRFQYEWHDDAGHWHRSYGNEMWEFDERGLMRRREASINDVPILETDRKFFWPAPGRRTTRESPTSNSPRRTPRSGIVLDLGILGAPVRASEALSMTRGPSRSEETYGGRAARKHRRSPRGSRSLEGS
jgi:uncharacterized protein